MRQVVGEGFHGVGDERPYLYTPGRGFRSLGSLVPNRLAGTACGLDGRGQVVGSIAGTTGPEPYLWTPAQGMRSVAPFKPGFLCDLNDRGEAIGRIGNDWGLWIRISGANGLFVKLGFEPRVLGRDGSVYGYSGGAVVRRDPFGAITRFPHPNVQFTSLSVSGANRAGVMAGRWQFLRKVGSSRIFRDGPMLHVPGVGTRDLVPANNGLVDPAWQVLLIYRVNELGQVVGSARKRPGTKGEHAVRLDPVSPAASVQTVGTGCGAAAPPTLQARKPVLGPPLRFVLRGAAKNARGVLLIGLPARAPIVLPGGCRVYVDLAQPVFPLAFTTDAGGAWNGKLEAEPKLSYAGVPLAAQAAVLGGTGLEMSAGLRLVLGF